ncbi:MAG: hypothetical protein ACP5UH_00620 [Candidatus Micrarchaeia archaeon]
MNKDAYALPGNTARSHTEAMLRNVLYGSGSRVNSNSSLLLHSLTTLTGSMRTVTYKRGFSIGKELYRMLNEKKHYATYEESIPDLVSFLERAGLGRIAYAAFEDGLALSVYNGEHRHVGTNIHVFEAGIMSGFVSSGRRDYSVVEEKACASNSADHCEFVFSASERRAEPQSGPGVEGKEIIDGLLGHIYKPQEGGGNLSDSYAALLSNMVADRKYFEEMGGIMAYIGGSVGDMVAKRSMNHRFEDMLGILDGIYTGMVTTKSKKPMSIEMAFDGTRLSKAYAKLSLSLLGGMLSKLYSTKRMKAIEINKYDQYKIKIAEEQ